MICILKFKNGEIDGWIIAVDIHEARRKAEMVGERELAAHLYRREFTPPPGRHWVMPEYLMLVD